MEEKSKRLEIQKDKIIFYGIGEQGATEICENLVKDLITTKMGLDATKINFDRIHRVGSDRAKKPDPSLANFITSLRGRR